MSENPCHVVCALPALNENATAMNTGSSVHSTYAMAISHRKCARAHGFMAHPRTRAATEGVGAAHRSASSRAAFVLRR